MSKQRSVILDIIEVIILGSLFGYTMSLIWYELQLLYPEYSSIMILAIKLLLTFILICLIVLMDLMITKIRLEVIKRWQKKKLQRSQT